MKILTVLFMLIFAGTLSADTAISVLGEIDEQLKGVNSKLVKGLLEKKVSEAWSIKDETKKIAELKSILAELKKLNKDQKPVDKNPQISVKKEIALCK